MLALSLANPADGVELTCDLPGAESLQRLRARFTSAVTVSYTTIIVSLDEFLLNLDALILWPDGDFVWSPRLLALVEGNYADSTVVAEELRTGLVAGDAYAEIPGGGWDAPMTDLQRRDLARLLRLRHGANFSVPGAGKTRVALALFQTRLLAGEVTRMLVVAPKSAFEAWVEETRLCLPNGPVVSQLSGEVTPVCDVLLVNYERLPNSLSALTRWLEASPSLLVLDEAHRMKLGSDGAWGSACYALGPHAAHRVILTGTPAPNGRQDLENLFGFVWPGEGRTVVNQAVVNRSLPQASELLRPLFTRTTKAQLNLPPVDLACRRVPLPPLHREIYDALVGISAREYPGGSSDAETLGKIVMYLLMAATSPALLAAGSSRYEPLSYKVPPLEPPPGSPLADLMRDLPSYELSPKYAEALAIVKANAEAGRKTLVWSTFVRSLTSLERLLARYAPAVVHGGTVDRDDQLRRFRQDPDCMVLLSNPATLGEGVSLHHACHDAVFVDRDFAAGRYLQSLDRIHRLGLAPNTRTTITILVADSTIDDVVNVRLDDKVRFLLQILDDPAVQQLTDLDEEPTTSGGMDSTDIAALVQYLQGHANL